MYTMRNLLRFLVCGKFLSIIITKRDKNRDFNISCSSKVSSAHFDEDFMNQDGQWETTVNSRISSLGGLFVFEFLHGGLFEGA